LQDWIERRKGHPCGLFVDATRDSRITSGVPTKPSALVDTRVIYCGDNLDQLRKLPEGCLDLIYIDPPFNSNRNYEVFWGETKEKRSFEDRHESRSPRNTLILRMKHPARYMP
jgi:16S rRNA G966 N2-methylase RsmD